PGRLTRTGNSSTLFAVADNFQRRSVNTLNNQEVTYRISTTLTQSHVVFTRTTLISMTFQTYGYRGTTQTLSVSQQQRARIRRQGRLVEAEVNDVFERL